MSRFLLVALLALGCTEPRDLYGDRAALETSDRLTAHWTISAEFSDDEIAAIVDAATTWSEATSGRVELTFDVADAAPGPWVISRAAEDGNVGGTTADSLDRITLRPDEAPGDRCARLMAAHELGHTFGLAHGGSGVMAETHTRACDRDINADDVALFEAANAT